MNKFETFGEKQEYEVASVSFNIKGNIPCQNCGCAFGSHESALATIERIRSLYERTCEATNKGCSDDLEEFLADLSLALDGEQE